MLIRRAEPPDALAVARVHVRSWQAGYRGLIADEYLDRLRPEDRASAYEFAATSSSAGLRETLVALDGGEITGFVTLSAARDADCSGSGEICALYVDPAQWGRGAGHALMDAARLGLIERGFTDAALWVLRGNERAMRFYDRDGWRADGSERSSAVWGIEVDELRYRRTLDS